MGCQHSDEVQILHEGQNKTVTVWCNKERAFTIEAKTGLFAELGNRDSYRMYGSSSIPLCEEHLDDAMSMMREAIDSLKMSLDAERNGWGD